MEIGQNHHYHRRVVWYRPGKPDEAKRLVDKTVERFERIDVLVNGAARAMASPVEKIDLDAYRRMLELNVVVLSI
jgi:NAD(P)-dependent dehydrogenase (short-subunit alcohol dehydrogenase family)